MSKRHKVNISSWWNPNTWPQCSWQQLETRWGTSKDLGSSTEMDYPSIRIWCGLLTRRESVNCIFNLALFGIVMIQSCISQLLRAFLIHTQTRHSTISAPGLPSIISRAWRIWVEGRPEAHAFVGSLRWRKMDLTGWSSVLRKMREAVGLQCELPVLASTSTTIWRC